MAFTVDEKGRTDSSPGIAEAVERARHMPHHYSPVCPCGQCQSSYWESMARSERTFAQQERTSRHGTVESIRIHEQNATDYDARAAIAKARA